MINIKSSTCEEDEFTKNRLLSVSFKKFEFGKNVHLAIDDLCVYPSI